MGVQNGHRRCQKLSAELRVGVAAKELWLWNWWRRPRGWAVDAILKCLQHWSNAFNPSAQSALIRFLLFDVFWLFLRTLYRADLKPRYASTTVHIHLQYMNELLFWHLLTIPLISYNLWCYSLSFSDFCLGSSQSSSCQYWIYTLARRMLGAEARESSAGSHVRQTLIPTFFKWSAWEHRQSLDILSSISSTSGHQLWKASKGLSASFVAAVSKSSSGVQRGLPLHLLSIFSPSLYPSFCRFPLWFSLSTLQLTLLLLRN